MNININKEFLTSSNKVQINPSPIESKALEQTAEDAKEGYSEIELYDKANENTQELTKLSDWIEKSKTVEDDSIETCCDNYTTTYYDNGKVKNRSFEDYYDNGQLEAYKSYTYTEEGLLKTSSQSYYYESGDLSYYKQNTYNDKGELEGSWVDEYWDNGEQKSYKSTLYNLDKKIITEEQTEYDKTGYIKSTETKELDLNENVQKKCRENYYDNGNLENKSYENYYDNGQLKESELNSYTKDGLEELSSKISYYENGGQSRNETNFYKNGSLEKTEIAEYDENGKTKNSTNIAYDSQGKIAESKKINKETELYYNGEIEHTKQGDTGDCWLLSGVNSLTYSETGKEMIKNAIEYEKDGVVMHLSGIDYKISNDELIEKKEEGKLSIGDDDMIIFEMVIERFRKDQKEGNLVYSDDFVKDNFYNQSADAYWRDNLEGGAGIEVAALVTGNIPKTFKVSKLNKLLDDKGSLKNKDTAITIGKSGKSSIVKDINGEKVELPSPHVYAVKSIENNIVTITDPQDSSKEIALDKKTFKKEFKEFTMVDLSQKNSEPIVIETTSETKKDLFGNETTTLKDKNGNILKKIKCNKKGELKGQIRYSQSGKKIYEERINILTGREEILTYK